MDAKYLSAIHQLIEAAGIPIDGVGSDGRIDFRPEATPEQRDQAAGILAGFDPAGVEARAAEVEQAPLTARQFFAASPAAIAFIRLTPEEQAAQIDGMTTAQLKTVIKYLAVAVSAAIKREFL